MKSRLAVKRFASGMSQQAFASSVGISRPTYSLIEQGRLKPTDAQLTKIASGLCWQGNPNELLKEVEYGTV